MEFVGTPDDAYMQGITNTSVCVCVCVCVCADLLLVNTQARQYLSSLPHYPKKDFQRFFIGADPKAIDLLLQLLDMDPDKRPTAEHGADPSLPRRVSQTLRMR